MNKELRELLNKQNALLNKAIAENRALTPDEEKENEELETKIENCKKLNAIKAKVAANGDEEEKLEAEEKAPVNDKLFAEVKNSQPVKLFKNFAEQLKAIKNVHTSGTVDDRLIQINNAATGMGEQIGPDGGFAVQKDFAGMMMETAVTTGNVLPLVDRYEVGAGSNGVKWVEIDETSVATTVFGGVQTYWRAEAGTVTAKKPTLIEKKMDLETLMGVAYATYELDQDTNFVSQLYSRAFTTAIQRELENAIINGNGAGKPLGFLTGANLVSVSKESGQAAATVLWENIVKMYNRQLNKNKAVWLMHPDVQQQIDFLSFPVGVGGVPVYLPASSVGTVPSLKGRPIVENDNCATLGTVVDINFVDLSEYMLITKGGVAADTSIHVQFLAAENCFRFIFRANGMPKKNSALTIKNSSNTRSSFVTVATRT
jgi:HK97 family phage major capsid protein